MNMLGFCRHKSLPLIKGYGRSLNATPRFACNVERHQWASKRHCSKPKSRMTVNSSIQNRPVLVLVSLMTASLAALLLMPPLVQDQSYHQFADQRALLGIPNFWNVVSNLPFVAVGAVGLWQFHRHAATIVLFLGICLTGFGSSYFHWDPSDATLFWDRLPMTICFAAILAVVIEERVDMRAGSLMLWPLLAIGVSSVLLWSWTGDLRLYAWAQFFPFLALVLILQLFKPRYSGAFYWIIAIVFYALAKLFEHFDDEIFSVGSVVSGHTLKHFAAAAGSFAILVLFQKRQLIGGAVRSD